MKRELERGKEIKRGRDRGGIKRNGQCRESDREME